MKLVSNYDSNPTNIYYCPGYPPPLPEHRGKGCKLCPGA